MHSKFYIPEKSNRSLTEFEFIHAPNDKTAKLGLGSFATVKLAREKKSRKLFALKMMDINPRKVSASDIDNLKVEISVHRILDHENIIKFHDYIHADPCVYIILDYAENGNLYTYLNRKKALTNAEIFKFFYQSCLAIDYLHKNNVMHRDIKPENILLDKNFNIKLCDLGWATRNIHDKRLTLCGTYEYMAPEIVHKVPYDYRIDIWSLGVLLFELIHIHAPYKGRSLSEITRSLATKTINFSPNIHPDAKDLILKILRHNPVERLTLEQILSHTWITSNLTQHQQSPKQILIEQPIQLQAQADTATSQQQPQKQQKVVEFVRKNSNNIFSDEYSPKEKKITQQPQQKQNSAFDASALNLPVLSPISTNILPNSGKNTLQPSSLNQISSQKTLMQPQTEKPEEAKVFKIFSREPREKGKTFAHISKSPITGQNPTALTGNPDLRDKENKDPKNLTNMAGTHQRERSCQNPRSLTIFGLNYASTPTDVNTLNPPALNKHHSESFATLQTNTQNEKVQKKKIFENNHLSPTFKMKLTDIMNEISVKNGTKKEAPTANLNSSYQSQKPQNNTTLPPSFTSRENTEETIRENPFNLVLNNQKDPEKKAPEVTSDQTPQTKTRLFGPTRSNSITPLNLKTVSSQPGLVTIPPTKEPSTNGVLKCHQGDENVLDLSASFSAIVIPKSVINTGLIERVESNQRNDEDPNASKGPTEFDINDIVFKIKNGGENIKFSLKKVYEGFEGNKLLDAGKQLFKNLLNPVQETEVQV